jgi:hypothetical protein
MRCVFLGYSNMHKGFKCLDISLGRIYISRDVVFNETAYPFVDLHPTAGAHYTSEVLLSLGGVTDLSIPNVLHVPYSPGTVTIDPFVHVQPQMILPPTTMSSAHSGADLVP